MVHRYVSKHQLKQFQEFYFWVKYIVWNQAFDKKFSYHPQAHNVNIQTNCHYTHMCILLFVLPVATIREVVKYTYVVHEASLTGCTPGAGSRESNPGAEKVHFWPCLLIFVQNCAFVIFMPGAHAPFAHLSYGSACPWNTSLAETESTQLGQTQDAGIREKSWDKRKDKQPESYYYKEKKTAVRKKYTLKNCYIEFWINAKLIVWVWMSPGAT